MSSPSLTHVAQNLYMRVHARARAHTNLRSQKVGFKKNTQRVAMASSGRRHRKWSLKHNLLNLAPLFEFENEIWLGQYFQGGSLVEIGISPFLYFQTLLALYSFKTFSLKGFQRFGKKMSFFIPASVPFSTTSSLCLHRSRQVLHWLRCRLDHMAEKAITHPSTM